ncbi:MAG: ATP-dependent helicase [Streptosporangiales bacterium]|nr:ATP-dependent helicase [Streptosporangiales bacterium]
MNPDELLEALDPEQRAAALAVRGPVCVLAGAGTGKTRAITHRIAYAAMTGVVNPSHVLALTFTVRAAGELRGRLRALGGGAEAVRASTFHAAALRQLTYFWPRAIGGRRPRLVESKHSLVREAARDLRLPRLDSTAIGDAVTEIEWAKVCQAHPSAYVPLAETAGRTPVAGVEAVGQLYQAYEQMCRDRQLIDFESVLELTAAILLTEPAFAREVHAAFRYFTVDEFQDVNPLQKLLLDAWLGGRAELCVVGDPQQTIYSFTGATPEYLRSFASDYPGAAEIRLVRDYRSSPQVVALANRLSSSGVPLVAQRPAGPEPSLSVYPDEEAEARGAAASVQSLLRRGVAPDEIAILLRINAHSERFERALDAAGIGYVVRGGERFYERPEVKQAIVLLRGAARAAEDDSDAEASGSAGGAGPSGSGLSVAVRHVLSSAGLTPAAPPSRGAARDKWESLAAIAALADDLGAERPDATLMDFAAELVQRAEAGHAPAANAVTLASMHAAKGLEWDAVVIPGLVEGIIPVVYARTAEEIESERRLLYVAVTRAREHLMLSWAPLRSSAGGSGTYPAGSPASSRAGQSRPRSRFLSVLFPSQAAMEARS